jgi:hypothetical protein
LSESLLRRVEREPELSVLRGPPTPDPSPRHGGAMLRMDGEGSLSSPRLGERAGYMLSVIWRRSSGVLVRMRP